MLHNRNAHVIYYYIWVSYNSNVDAIPNRGGDHIWLSGCYLSEKHFLFGK